MHNNKPAQQRISIRQKTILIIFGLFLFLILLEIGLRLSGFIFLSLQEYRNIVSTRQNGTYRIICLGESTTAGGGHNSYPSQLEEILNERDIGIKFSVINKGVIGANTAALLNQLEDNLNKYKPNMVIAMTGYMDGGSHIPFENANASRIVLYLRHLKTYKLFRLLWLHIVTKIKEIGPCNIKMEKGSTKLQPNLSITEESEHSLKKTTELDPNGLTYFILVWRTIKEGKLVQAEELLKKAIELDPRNDWAYLELGKYYYINRGDFTRTKELIEKTIEQDPGNDGAYVGLGWVYQLQRKFNQAEESFKKAIELDSKNVWAYLALGRCYLEEKKYTQAEELFRKAIELDHKNLVAYIDFGMCYKDQGKLAEAEELLKKAIELDYRFDKTYIELIWVYKDQGKFSEAEELLKKAIELDPKDDWAYGSLVALYAEMNKHGLMQGYAEMVNRLRSRYYSPVTRNNYRKIKEILDKKKVKLVCVQYPMRSVEPLKKIFAETEGIIFVDNERIFKDALKKTSFKEYFTDMIGGDFGHCTPKGNRLLAKNIADTILKENFNK